MAKLTSEQKRANQDAAGIPDSRPFISDEPMESGASRMLACHISGVLIADLHLDPQVLTALDYWATDEGQAERAASPNPKASADITIGADGFSKALDQRRDDVRERDMDSYIARDPLKEVADRYVKPGMSPRFMSAQRIKDGGGTGDYEVVKDAAGDPVKVRGMVLGQMPSARAKARNEHYRGRGNVILKQITERHKAEGGVADE